MIGNAPAGKGSVAGVGFVVGEMAAAGALGVSVVVVEGAMSVLAVDSEVAAAPSAAGDESPELPQADATITTATATASDPPHVPRLRADVIEIPFSGIDSALVEGTQSIVTNHRLTIIGGGQEAHTVASHDDSDAERCETEACTASMGPRA
ncbi:MAG: hypothetical protein ABIO83_09275 [Ilumatobacteraceae bacterium]